MGDEMRLFLKSLAAIKFTTTVVTQDIHSTEDSRTVHSAVAQSLPMNTPQGAQSTSISQQDFNRVLMVGAEGINFDQDDSLMASVF
ncbi:hypothetical protein GJ496_002425 [Pomphorhynchus laevis]|nr:hypothetical protein GJ496_002425 [Pomphorhynchus laevis]